MPWLLHHHHSLLTCTDGSRLRRLLAGAMPADGWKGAVDGGMLVQAEVDEERRKVKKENGHGKIFCVDCLSRLTSCCILALRS